MSAATARAVAAQLDAARLQAFDGEGLILEGADLALEKAITLGDERTFEAAGGKSVGGFAGDIEALGQRFRRATHGRVDRGVEQRFPQEILELNLPHAKAGAMRIGGDGVATHRFSADTERKAGPLLRNRIGGLAQHFDSSAANALHQVCRDLRRNT